MAPGAVAPESGDSGETFLTRWSRRKLGRGDPAQPVLANDGADQRTDEETVAPGEVADAALPSLDVLDENSDYSAFLSPEVTGEVRKSALRKLFRSAKFNVTDGLDDYDDDFRTFAALGDVLTADMRHRLEQEAEKARDSLAQQAREEVVEDNPVAEPGAEDDLPPERLAAAPGDALTAGTRDDPDTTNSQR